MKKKIRLMAKGVFEYENPKIVVSQEKIEFDAAPGKKTEGFFEIHSINGVEIRAMLFSSNKHMVCLDKAVIGERSNIFYSFDATELEAGQVITGQFSIISNGGEIEIPYKVKVAEPYFESSIGNIHELQEFTELARHNWNEATTIFADPRFAKIFLSNKKYMHNYNLLVQSHDINRAMEEFLCFLKRKKPVHLKVYQTEIEYNNLREPISESIVIEKDTWGYEKIQVSSVGSFIKLHKSVITSEDFLGSYYELDYEIDPKSFVRGNEFGKITLSTFNKVFEIPVTVSNEYRDNEVISRKSKKELAYDLESLFVDHMVKSIKENYWRNETQEVLAGLRCYNDKPNAYSMFEAHYMSLTGKNSDAIDALESLDIKKVKAESPLLYAYYLYIMALSRKQASYTKYAVDKIHSLYGVTQRDYRILLMLLELSEYMPDDSKINHLKDAFNRGTRSPLIYAAAALIYNRDPSLVREFSDFEIQVVNWAGKHKAMDYRVVFQLAMSAQKSRKFNPIALKNFTDFYQAHNNNELLNAICTILINGAKTDKKYNKWYKLGILRGIRITELYEFYMYSLDDSEPLDIPREVLLYFNYDNKLSAELKAVIYAYVIEHKSEIPRLFNDYENIMKAFTHEQLGRGYVDKHMIVLYRHFIDVETKSRKVLELLPNIIFKHEIWCSNPDIVGVIVSQREIEKEVYYPLKNGRAYVDICMEDYMVALVDKDDNRYISTVGYKVRPLMLDNELIKNSYKANDSNHMVILNRSEKAIKYQKTDDISIEIYKKVLRIPNISNYYQKSILKNLIDFYYDNYEGMTLEKYLLQLDISLLDIKERGDIIEYYIQRGIYERAYDAISVYGYEGVDPKRIMRLCSRIIRSNPNTQDDLLLEMAYSAFCAGKYDEMILDYLVKYYMGTTKDYYEIWRAAMNFELNAELLEERMLCQVLFSESFITQGEQVFESYYQGKPDERIVQAFLAFYAYVYLIKGQKAEEKMFDFMQMEMDQMDGGQDVCGLALLKYNAETDPKEAKKKTWVYDEVGKFLSKDIALPFFKVFADELRLPKEIFNYQFATYVADPKSTVKIHYIFHNGTKEDKSYVEEDMRNVFNGIFVKAFNLYAGEEVRYYITEKSEFGENITEHTVIRPDDNADLSGTAFASVNDMITYNKERKFNKLDKEIEAFENKKILSKELFDLLD